MKTLWAPWRMEYIAGEKQKGCVFCLAREKEAALTLLVSDHVLVVMNKYPYTNGHLLVAPVRHVPALSGLTVREMAVLVKTVEQSISILQQTMHPDGFNVGVNQGRVAGAGVEEHLHFHIVPRWSGDTNAMTVLADVRVIPEHIQATHASLKPWFDKLNPAAWLDEAAPPLTGGKK